MTDKYYKWILDCVHDWFSFKSREFENKELGLKLGIYRNRDNDYYIELKVGEKISVLTGGEKLSKGQMIDLLEHSFSKDFEYPKTVDIDKIYKLKDENSNLLEMVSDLKRINESIIIDNNNKTKENYELRNEVKRLGERLQEEKNAHTTTQCRAIFAKHILNGDRDEKVKEHTDTYGV